MDDDWTMLFDDYGSEIHESFRKELSIQLLQKGDRTGIKNFKRYNFQLIVGMIPLDLEIQENSVYATIELITPTSYAFPVRVNWKANVDNASLLTIHKNELKGKR